MSYSKEYPQYQKLILSSSHAQYNTDGSYDFNVNLPLFNAQKSKIVYDVETLHIEDDGMKKALNIKQKQNEKIFGDSVVAYYDFSSQDDLGRDVSGNGLHAFTNGLTYSTERSNSIEFTQASFTAQNNPQRVELTQHLNVFKQMGRNITVSGWFKTSASTGVMNLFSITNDVEPSEDMLIFHQGAKLRFDIRIGTNLFAVASVNNVNDNEWHHFVASCGSAGNFLYLDNVLQTTYTIGNSSNTTSFQDLNYNRINMGASKDNKLAYEFSYNGFLADFIIFKEQISADMVSKLYNNDYGYDVYPLMGEANMIGRATLEAGVDDDYTLLSRVFQFPYDVNFVKEYFNETNWSSLFTITQQSNYTPILTGSGFDAVYQLCDHTNGISSIVDLSFNLYDPYTPENFTLEFEFFLDGTLNGANGFWDVFIGNFRFKIYGSIEFSGTLRNWTNTYNEWVKFKFVKNGTNLQLFQNDVSTATWTVSENNWLDSDVSIRAVGTTMSLFIRRMRMTRLDNTGNIVDGTTISQATNPLDHITNVLGGSDGETADTTGLWKTCFEVIASNTKPIRRKILLVPLAKGETSFVANNWNKGDPLYNAAVNATNKVVGLHPWNKLKSILWLQGESDNGNANHLTQLTAFFDNLKIDIPSFNDYVPFVVGQVNSGLSSVNAVLQTFVNSRRNANIVLTSDSTLFDTVHYNLASLRTIGHRFANEIVECQGVINYIDYSTFANLHVQQIQNISSYSSSSKGMTDMILTFNKPFTHKHLTTDTISNALPYYFDFINKSLKVYFTNDKQQKVVVPNGQFMIVLKFFQAE